MSGIVTEGRGEGLAEMIRKMIVMAMERDSVSQRRLAREMGLSEPRISQMLSKPRAANLTLATVERISIALQRAANTPSGLDAEGGGRDGVR